MTNLDTHNARPLPVELGGCPYCGHFAQCVLGRCENSGCPGAP